jgi:hypothetical protein
MFLYKCIGFTYITDTILSLINKCNIFINKSQILQCLNKEYMYSKYCNITNDMCECIQNNIIYNNSFYSMNYYLIIIYISVILLSICCCFTKATKLSLLNGHYVIQNLENNDENTKYYIIDKTDNLPKYNEIESENENKIDNTQITIVEISPPKYNESV